MIRIDACKQGDRRALGELYAAYSRKLLGICRYYVKDESVVEDILHDAFIIIFSSISTLKDEAKLEGWMITIVRNLCLKHLQRAEGRENLLPLVNADALPDESHGTNGSMDLATLLDAIESLPNGHREVFKLAVLDGLSHKEDRRTAWHSTPQFLLAVVEGQETVADDADRLLAVAPVAGVHTCVPLFDNKARGGKDFRKPTDEGRFAQERGWSDEG